MCHRDLISLWINSTKFSDVSMNEFHGFAGALKKQPTLDRRLLVLESLKLLPSGPSASTRCGSLQQRFNVSRCDFGGRLVELAAQPTHYGWGIGEGSRFELADHPSVAPRTLFGLDNVVGCLGIRCVGRTNFLTQLTIHLHYCELRTTSFKEEHCLEIPLRVKGKL